MDVILYSKISKINTELHGGSSETETEVLLSSLTKSNFRIMSNGWWASLNNAGYIVPLTSDIEKISIKGHASRTSYYAFLPAYNPVNAEDANIIGHDGTPTNVESGSTVTENVPATAKFLFIGRMDGNGYNIDPQFFKITSLNVTKGIADQVNEMQNGESVEHNGSYYQTVEGNFKAGSCWRLKLYNTNASYAEIKALTDASDVSTAETQFNLFKDNEVIWSPLKDYEAIRYGVDGSSSLSINDCSSIYDEIERKVFYCGASREYTKLIDAINEAEKYMGSILYVDEGTYDLVTEFGSAYFAGITNESMPGITLKNRIHIIFSPNSYVTCHYTGDNEKVLKNFSPFNCGQYGFTIENLNLSSSRVRYAIHDERNGKTELCKSHYINCNIIHDNTQNEEWTSYSCIGGGLGSNHEVIIENCVFESVVGSGETVHGCVYYHPSNDTGNPDFAAKVTVKDNYFVTGTLELSGSRTDASIDTVVIFTNNSVEYNAANAQNGIYFSGNQSYQGTHYNIKAWNNEMRQ